MRILYNRVMRRIIILLCIFAIFCPFSFALPQANGFPFVLYNSVTGYSYGGIGKFSGLSGKNDSLTFLGYLIENGGSFINFVYARPLAFELEGNFGLAAKERFYGIGGSPANTYSTFDNELKQLRLKYFFPVNRSLYFQPFLYYAENNFKNTNAGNPPLSAGLAENTGRYYLAGLKLAADSRDPADNPSSGALVAGEFDQGNGFAKVVIDARKYLPLSGGRVLASRLNLVQALGDSIPFYEYALLGGRDSLRGYAYYRFMDKSSALINLEYRVPVWSWLGLVIFYDAGKTAPSILALGTNDWHSNLGLGIRGFLGDLVVRGDFGVGSEGLQVNFFYGQAF